MTCSVSLSVIRSFLAYLSFVSRFIVVISLCLWLSCVFSSFTLCCRPLVPRLSFTHDLTFPSDSFLFTIYHFTLSSFLYFFRFSFMSISLPFCFTSFILPLSNLLLCPVWRGAVAKFSTMPNHPYCSELHCRGEMLKSPIPLTHFLFVDVRLAISYVRWIDKGFSETICMSVLALV